LEVFQGLILTASHRTNTPQFYTQARFQKSTNTHQNTLLRAQNIIVERISLRPHGTNLCGLFWLFFAAISKVAYIRHLAFIHTQ